MSEEELRDKAQRREVRGFLDSGSWQFRKTDIEEFARQRGIGSDPDLTLTDSDSGAGTGQYLSCAQRMLNNAVEICTVRAIRHEPCIEHDESVAGTMRRLDETRRCSRGGLLRHRN